MFPKYQKVNRWHDLQVLTILFSNFYQNLTVFFHLWTNFCYFTVCYDIETCFVACQNFFGYLCCLILYSLLRGAWQGGGGVRVLICLGSEWLVIRWLLFIYTLWTLLTNKHSQFRNVPTILFTIIMHQNCCQNQTIVAKMCRWSSKI